MSGAVDKAVAAIVLILEPRAPTQDIVRIAYLQGQIDALREARSRNAARAPLFPPQDDSFLEGLPQ